MRNACVLRPGALLFVAAVLLAGGAAAQAPAPQKTGIYPCGRQPKQVIFSPDGSCVVLPLLEDDGFDVFSVAEKRVVRRVRPPQSGKQGFAEGLFVPEKQAFFVSQMTTGTVYEYSWPGFELRRSIDTGGTWSKFIAWEPMQGLLAVSNWVSNDISLIDYATGRVVRTLRTAAAPRGMVFTDGGTALVSLAFEGGAIERFDVGTGTRTAVISVPDAAMRHIVLSADGRTAYVSDMYHRSVYRVDLAAFKITQTVKVFNNPNTIALLDDRWLFVSCRGPNNKADYTKRSPENGKIYVIDTADMSTARIIPGGNQPTGLALSPDGRTLCFSDFQDAALELWRITPE